MSYYVQSGLERVGKGLSDIAQAISKRPAPVTYNIIFNVPDGVSAAELAEKVREVTDEAAQRARPVGG